MLSASLTCNSWAATNLVDLIDQIPGPLIGHIHGATGGGDRTTGVNVFKEVNLTRPDPPLRIKIDTNT